MDKIYSINNEAFDISSLAIQAMMYEVTCYPSPGLVSFISNGAHKDMDYYSFIDSTASLAKYLTLCAKRGMESGNPKAVFLDLKQLGIEAEKCMLKKTKGVNTHKGMLFLMGICCAAAGVAAQENKKFGEIQQIIIDITEGIVKRDLEPILEKKHLIKDGKYCGRNLSYGEKLFLEHEIKGIRGEIEKGLPLIFNFALNLYKETTELNKNHRLVHVLIGIMQYSEDTNIIHRHSIDMLKYVQEKSKYIMSIGGMKTEKGREAIKLLDREFVEKNISPGGTADLLAVTVFLYFVEEYLQSR